MARLYRSTTIGRGKSRRSIFRVKCFGLLGALTLFSACYDFTDPDFPEAGAPAVLQATTFRDDTGLVTIAAQLTPGLSIGGIQRKVPNDTLDIYGFKLTPVEIKTNGTRVYSFVGRAITNGSAPFVLNGPRVDEVTGPPPHANWFPIRKTDPDTVVWVRGTDLILHVDTALGVSSPTPPIRQWFLTVAGTQRDFRISSDGAPPVILRIPAEWVPPVNTPTTNVFLSFFQSGQQQSPTRDYIGLITFNIQIRWIVRIIGS